MISTFHNYGRFQTDDIITEKFLQQVLSTRSFVYLQNKTSGKQQNNSQAYLGKF